MTAFLELKGRMRRRELEAPHADHAAPRWPPMGAPVGAHSPCYPARPN